MARFPRLQVLQTICDSGLVPLFYDASAETAFDVARACAGGGAAVLEFTHRGDGAHRVLEELLARVRSELPRLAVGVGSIRDPHTAALYLAIGVDFIVGPTLDPDVARLANGRKVAYLPGCATPGEIAAAEQLGCEIVKVFPGGAAGGPDFIKAVRGPSPWSSLMPTGGVDVSAESIGAWIRAGAVAVGIGSALISRGIVAEGRFEELTARTRQALEWVRDARGAKA